MAQCYCCGKMLTNPDSVIVGIGPYCDTGKCKCGRNEEAAEARKLAQTPVGDAKKEAEILKFLHRKGITVKFANNSRTAEKQDRQLKKQKYIWIKGYAYHSYDLIPQRLKVNNYHEVIAVAHDSIYRSAKEGEDPHTEMVISLFHKKQTETETEKQQENDLATYW